MSRVTVPQSIDLHPAADVAPVRGAGSSDSSLRWFLVFTKPSGEKLAQDNLERQGYRVYFPQLLRRVMRGGRRMERIVALFPRYLFIELDSVRQSLATVRSTLGVANVVRFGIEPQIVPDGIVRGLMSRADPASGLHVFDAEPQFESGSRVNVIAGAFAGLDGIFLRNVSEHRVAILLRLLGQEAAVQLPGQNLVLAD
jgi:transcriptional antiterminator RfaH